ncbi:MAG TPA: SHOCT domain-containing protein [Nitrososphaera sp.]|jgi:putative membrane protein|nr:SHOCT domain-containing protein [Nitrososphaera sp.]
MSDQESNSTRRFVGWGIIIVGLIVVIGLSIALSLYYFAPWRLGVGGDFGYPFFFSSFPFHFGWLGVILLIFLVVFLVARWLFFWTRRERGGEEGGYYTYPQQQRPDAASIVKERYAKGEITREQFEQMMRDLRQHEGGD